MIEQIFSVKDEHEFLEKTSIHLLNKIHEILETQEFCRLGLSGGSTPKKLYRRLAELHIPWEKMVLIVLDERNVSLSDPHSNYGMIRDELLSMIKIPDEQVVFFDTELGYDSAVLSTEQKLIHLKKERLPLFDHLILGVGADGHIAGIFPETPSPQKGFLTMKTHTDMFDVGERMTATMEALTSCASATLLVNGHEKTRVLNAITGSTGAIEGQNNLPIMEFIAKVPTTVYAVNV
ncbi:MAG: 6-phosphogluconolactonase [Candidatus Peregrinibacteria bacterium]|nr:6-phosphogluconolactonase [Candidatus Peregrinibacteria bacterium]